MRVSDVSIKIRRALSNDATSLCAILNEIISAGGTTALETNLTDRELDEHYISGPDCIFCFIAELDDGEALGFQTLVKNADLPTNWGDVGTFTRREPHIAGVGTALFEYTKHVARGVGIAAINATIRADNSGGIAYYEKLGFRTYNVLKGLPLGDGTPIDRVVKLYSLE
jgi:GNAT superfamily N-acetyltransferase